MGYFKIFAKIWRENLVDFAKIWWISTKNFWQHWLSFSEFWKYLATLTKQQDEKIKRKRENHATRLLWVKEESETENWIREDRLLIICSGKESTFSSATACRNLISGNFNFIFKKTNQFMNFGEKNKSQFSRVGELF